MLKTIVPAALDFRDGVPYSRAYGDIYHAAEGGVGQANHVFVQGCGLPDAWAGRAHFTILETGFGAGLNFLATWAAWRADPARCACLHFLSIDKHPFQRDDMAILHAQWPQFAALSQELLQAWPMLMPGFHRIALDHGRVRLTLILGEVSDGLPQIQARLDAIYLDGFAPDRNADMWRAKLFYDLARLAQSGARLATYTVQAAVREGLRRAGFVCEKRPGFGRKRHCLAAHFAGQAAATTVTPPRQVTVIGAGVAGAAVAHALAQRGVAVTVLERAPAPAQGASGNPLAVFRPVISRDDALATRFTRAAFLHALRAWPELDAVEWSRCGVLHLARDGEVEIKLQQALAATAPPAEFARWVDLAAARELANWDVAMPGIFYPEAGWIAPVSLCRAWLEHASITLKTGCAVARLQTTADGWHLLTETGETLQAEAVVLANAADALRLMPDQAWPLEPVRGQITQLPTGCLPGIRRVIAREGYVAVADGRVVVGATYEYGMTDSHTDVASTLANLARLEAILPGADSALAPDALGGRASIRASLPDRMPMLGAVSGQPGLFIAAGYASRGVVWAGLLGETLADQLCGSPAPLERDLLRVLSPARYRADFKRQ